MIPLNNSFLMIKINSNLIISFDKGLVIRVRDSYARSRNYLSTGD